MSVDTGIAWTDSTHNPWSGCSKVSAGCTNCYAADLPPAMRRHAVWGPTGTRVRASPAYLAEPHKWNAKAAKAGIRHRVFCASVADVFEDRADLDPWREDLWATIAATPWLDWQLLTKRPHVAARWAESHSWPVNAWIGTSVEDQAAADERILHLLRVPARIRFLSCEPLIGPVILGDSLGTCRCNVEALEGAGQHHPRCPATRSRIDWVITGGESGHHARSMDPEWALDIIRQCQAAEVPVFHKQMGSVFAEIRAAAGIAAHPKGGDPREWPKAFRVREFPSIIPVIPCSP